MKEEIIAIRTEYIRLDQLLKFAGVVPTGGMAKEMILTGDITVNGEVCILRGKKLYDGDRVEFRGGSFCVRKNEDS